jgi:DNA polymerase-3 subunit chi
VSTPKISFYPLDKGNLDDALLYACRLTEKAVQLGHKVHLLVRSQDQALKLDELLWQFRPDSFVPHQTLPLQDGACQPDCPVTLGTQDHLPETRDILVNLGAEVWDHFQQFEDIREIVAAEDSERNLGRQRYRYYQDKGCSLETKKLSTGTGTGTDTGT